MIHNPVTECGFWEQDMFPSYKHIFCKNITYSAHKSYHDSTPDYKVDRFTAEKITYENQNYSLLNQFFYNAITTEN